MCQLHGRNFTQRYCAATCGRYQHIARDSLRIGTKLTRIANADCIALAAFDRRRHSFGAERGPNHILHVGNRQSVATKLLTVGFDLKVIASDDPLGKRARCAGNRLDGGFNFARKALHLLQVFAEHFDADWRSDAGRQHIDARLDRHGPGVGYARELQRLVHLADELVDRHTRSPLFLGLQVDDGFEHFSRCRIGRGASAAGLAEY